MFKKTGNQEDDGDKESWRTAPNFEVRTRNVSVIGPTLKIKGELSANEDLVIEGEIEGIIAHQDKNLMVGKSGCVRADIHAKQVEIHGRVDGDIRGDDIVRLAKTAEVHGNIQCGRISMEDGAQFTGSITMEKRAAKQSPLKTVEQAEADKKVKSDKVGGFAGSA